MAFLQKIKYQKRKYELRGIVTPPVTNIIFSEDSSQHWKFLEVANFNVLDLGFGRWGVSNLNETSPIFFKNRGAKKIIGVDLDEGEINYFKEYFKTNFKDDSVFKKIYINNPNHIDQLIKEQEINIIKCDIEGAEINLFKLDFKQYESLVGLAIEYHSPVLLKELILWNKKNKLDIIDHSIFSEHPQMGVISLRKTY